MIEYKSAYFNNKLYYSTLSKMKAIEDFCNKKIQEDVRFEVVAFKEINNDNDEIVLLYKQNTTKRIMRMKEFVYKSINGEHNLYDTEDNTLTLSAFYKNKLKYLPHTFKFDLIIIKTTNNDWSELRELLLFLWNSLNVTL